MEEACDKKRLCVAVLTELSKVTNCLIHVLLMLNYMLLVSIANLVESSAHTVVTGFQCKNLVLSVVVLS